LSQRESLCLQQGCIHYPTTSSAVLQCPKKWRPGGELDGAGCFPYVPNEAGGCVQKADKGVLLSVSRMILEDGSLQSMTKITQVITVTEHFQCRAGRNLCGALAC